MRKIIFLFFYMLFLGNSNISHASGLEHASDVLFVLSDLVRSCDTAYEVMSRTDINDKDYDRYDREWRDLEKRLEKQRVLAFAGLAGIPETLIWNLRRDHGWDYLCDKYHIDRKKFHYGFSRHDHDRDKWKGIPPGLAKKDGLPPGQAKKHHKHKEKKHHKKEK